MTVVTETHRSWPWLPVELVENIISEAWSSPMPVDDRIALFTSLCLVNRTWLSLFIHTALRDVHVPCPLFASQYMRMLRSRTSLEPDDDYMLSSASSTANNLCRSMTFHVDGNRTRAVVPHPEPAIRLYSHLDRAANAISNTLYMVDMLGYLPNLRHVAIEYIDWGFDDIFDQLRLMAFPDQVTRLDIKFSYSAASLLPLADGLREHYVRRWHPHWSTPHVRHLCISGAPVHFVADIIETCPGIETLELDCPARLEALAPLPSSVRTLVLRMPSGSVHRKSVEKWGLNAAVEAGLFFYPTRPRIVINSGPIEPSAWKEMQRLCRVSSIQLVHRPYAHVAAEAFCGS